MSAAGDSFVSRQASGLPVERKEFCILPPAFNNDAPEAKITKIINTIFANVLQNCNGGTTRFRAVLRRLLARILYSLPWLKKHCLSLVTGVPFLFGPECWDLRTYVFCGYDDDKNCPHGLTACGIPPHLIMTERVIKVMTNVLNEV